MCRDDPICVRVVVNAVREGAGWVVVVVVELIG